jgi:hypothetical protein
MNEARTICLRGYIMEDAPRNSLIRATARVGTRFPPSSGPNFSGSGCQLSVENYVPSGGKDTFPVQLKTQFFGDRGLQANLDLWLATKTL